MYRTLRGFPKYVSRFDVLIINALRMFAEMMIFKAVKVIDLVLESHKPGEEVVIDKS